MTTELTMLAWAIIIGLVHVAVAGQFTVAQHGISYGLSPRDERRELTGVGGRVERAFTNYTGNFPFFAAAVLVTHVASRHSWATMLGSEIYVAARLAFVVLYAAGIPGLRTMAFLASVVGIVMILSALT